MVRLQRPGAIENCWQRTGGFRSDVKDDEDRGLEPRWQGAGDLLQRFDTAG
jgi:hypothetical protein